VVRAPSAKARPPQPPVRGVRLEKTEIPGVRGSPPLPQGN